jgi:hypothetical protein
MIIKDMPKLESPFIRKKISNKISVVTPEIAPGYEWVFEDNDVLCTEKLDGTNVSIVIENGKITRVFNRTTEVPFFGKPSFIIRGLLNSFERGYCDLPDGQHFGELIGPKVQGNPYKLDDHIWIPFETYVRKHLVYQSWHNYPKTFESISEWFRAPLFEGGIFSLFARQKGILMKPEGVVFHNLKTGQMAKLRLDMFDWYEGKRHR